MQTVLPIKEIKKIEGIKNMLRGANKIRDLLLFEIGINSALRIGDLLKTKVYDVFDEQGRPKESFSIKEQKTGKMGIIYITPKVVETLKLYKQTYPSVVKNTQHYLFFRKKKFNKKIDDLGGQHISPCMARVLISGWCKDVGLVGNYGTHSMRKTRGYQARKNNIELSLIQFRLNHSNMAVTKRYLGITNDELQDVCLKLDL